MTPEEQRFEDAQTKLENFKEEHPDIFRSLEVLIEEYNDARAALERLARERGDSVGPFKLLRSVQKIDAEKACDLLSPEEFEKVGGKIETRRVFEVDKYKFNQACAMGVIPLDVAREIVSVIHHFSKVKGFDV